LTKPVDINEASRNELLRVPGIGPKTANKIVKMRQFSKRPLKRVHLNHTGAILKRADPFIKVNGWTQKSLQNF
ncbi:ComEA family DNA-binding protein, partial [Nanoarchaeota archaeon]